MADPVTPLPARLQDHVDVPTAGMDAARARFPGELGEALADMLKPRPPLNAGEAGEDFLYLDMSRGLVQFLRLAKALSVVAPQRVSLIVFVDVEDPAEESGTAEAIRSAAQDALRTHFTDRVSRVQVGVVDLEVSG